MSVKLVEQSLCNEVNEGNCELRYGLRRYKRTPALPSSSLMETCISRNVDRDGLAVKKVNKEIGKGVFATKQFLTAEFLLDYDGELISGKEARKREKEYPLEYGSYIFFFGYKGQKLGIDGTFSKRMGRYVNDGVGNEQNCEMVLAEIDNKPHLALFATRDIEAGEELRYDYGVKNLPWRSKVKKNTAVGSENGTTEKSVNVVGTIVSKAESYLKVVKKCTVKLVRLSMDKVNIVTGLGGSSEINSKDRLVETDHCGANTDIVQHENDLLNKCKDIETAAMGHSKQDQEFSSIPGIEQDQELVSISRKEQKDNTCNKIILTAIVDMPQVNSGDVEDMPQVNSGDVEDMPQVNSGDVEDMPQVNSGDVEDMPQVNSGDVKDMPQVNSGDVEDMPQVNSGDVEDMPQVNSGDVEDMPQVNSGDVEDMPQVNSGDVEDMPQVNSGDVEDMPQVNSGDVEDMPQRNSGDLEDMPQVNSGDVEDMPQVNSGDVEDMPQVNSGDVEDMPQVNSGDVEDMPQRNSGDVEDMPQVNPGDVEDMPQRNSGDLEDLPQVNSGDVEDMPQVNSSDVEDMSQVNSGDVGDTPQVNSVDDQLQEIEDLNVAKQQEDNNTTVHLLQKKSRSVPDNEVSKKKPDNYSRPKRPCPFCGKFFRRLSAHLKTKVHRYEEAVQVALSKPKADRNQMFKELRRTGYHKVNIDRVKHNANPDLIIERSTGKDKEHVICSFCKGAFRIPYISRHKRTCHAAEDTTAIPVSIPMSLIAEPKEKKVFIENILAKFKDDDVGNLCRSDAFIKKYGAHRFRKFNTRIDKRQEIRVNVMCEMRRLAGLFLALCTEAEKNSLSLQSATDMFKRQHFEMLQDALAVYTTREDGTQKSGLKRGLGYLLKRVGKYLKGSLLIEMKDDEVKEIDNFLFVLKIFWVDVFDDAEYNCLKARQKYLRMPKRLPVEAEVTKLRDFTLNEIKQLSSDRFNLMTKEDYVKLRNLIVSRLTLFNARRGGEPGRLELKEWEDAKNGNWLDKNMIRTTTDPLEKMMLGRYKLAYQSGKNITQLVPNLIPEDCWEGIMRLVDPGIRHTAGVNNDNNYVFPHIRGSMNHVSGWKCTRSACILSELSSVITATDMRHRASTLYAALDVSEHDRETFYKHMGHSAEVNKHVYQCPVGVQEITRVGKFLEQIDELPSEKQGKKKMESNSVVQNGPAANENVSELEVQEFLHQLADKDVVNRARNGWGLIDEDEVETIPEKLLPYKHIVLKSGLQNIVKCFFTDDGWMVAKNTVMMLEGMESSDRESDNEEKDSQENNTGENESDYFDSDLVDSESSSGEEDIVKSLREKKQKKIPTIKSLHHIPTGFRKHISKKQTSKKRKERGSDSESEYNPDLYSSSDDEEQEVKKIEKRKLKKRKKSSEDSSDMRVKWTEKDSTIIKSYFKDVIEDVSTLEPVGKLPGQKIIKQFLQAHPDVLNTVKTETEKIKKVKNKLFNDRKTVRLNYKRFMEKKIR